MTNNRRPADYKNLSEPQRSAALRYEEALRQAGSHRVKYWPILAKLSGKATAGLMLSQAIYWSSRTKPDGWFYKTAEQWTAETSLSRHEQETARRTLKRKGFWEERRSGQPPKIHYRVNFEVLFNAIVNRVSAQTQAEASSAEKQSFVDPDFEQSNFQILPPEHGAISNSDCPQSASCYKERITTPQTTAETTKRDETSALNAAEHVCDQLGIVESDILDIISKQIARETKSIPGLSLEACAESMIHAYHTYQKSDEGRSRFRKSLKTFFSGPTWKEDPKVWDSRGDQKSGNFEAGKEAIELLRKEAQWNG